MLELQQLLAHIEGHGRIHVAGHGELAAGEHLVVDARERDAAGRLAHGAGADDGGGLHREAPFFAPDGALLMIYLGLAEQGSR